jgi:hypothetical protein
VSHHNQLSVSFLQAVKIAGCQWLGWPVVHIHNPSYLGYRDQNDLGKSLLWENIWQDPYLKNTQNKAELMEWLRWYGPG